MRREDSREEGWLARQDDNHWAAASREAWRRGTWCRCLVLYSLQHLQGGEALSQHRHQLFHLVEGQGGLEGGGLGDGELCAEAEAAVVVTEEVCCACVGPRGAVCPVQVLLRLAGAPQLEVTELAKAAAQYLQSPGT